jgi:MFS family permease
VTDTVHGQRRSFWVLAVLLGFFLFAASAPSPLYPIYAARWRFSSITLTVIYAVYAAGALAALLIAGRLSDHLGRRRVVIVALVVQILGLALFIAARGEASLFIARILQGVATGIASGAISAWMVDLQPPETPGLAGLVGSIALLAGLGGGAFGSGLLVEYAPDPLHLVYWLMIAVFMLAIAPTVLIPDVNERRVGAFQSMRPQVGVPPTARSAFVALAPTLVAMWALAGLYLALGPSLAVTLLRTESRAAGGVVIVALMGAAAAGSAFARAREPRTMVIAGSLILTAGVAVTLVAVVGASPVGLYAGSAIGGVGLGPAFSGVMRTLSSLAPPDKRGALFGSIYILIYVSISVPTVLAGFAVARFPLANTTYVYGGAVMILAAITTVAVARSSPRGVDPGR